MAKKKEPKLQLPNDDKFIEDLLWMSYRYCVGRRTIAAAMHAPNIVSFLKLNPHVCSPERREFMAQDIRNEISTRIAWRSDVKTNGGQIKVIDVLSAILNALIEMQPDGNFNEGHLRCMKFHVKNETGEVTIEKTEPTEPVLASHEQTILHEISDYMPWVKLANWLDPHESIKFEYDGEKHEEKGFAYFSYFAGILHKNHTTVEHFGGYPYVDSHLDPDLITNITKI